MNRRAVAFVPETWIDFVVSDKNAQLREDAHFRVLRLLERRSDASQREIAEELGVSLGAVNYCVKALIDKGYIRLANFKAAKNKLGYAYVLTPEGITRRAQMAAGFIQRKIFEFEAMQAELEQLKAELAQDPPRLDQGWMGGLESRD